MNQVIDYEQLAAKMIKQFSGGQAGTRLKHTSPGSTPTVYYGHGDGGLFSYPGLSQNLFSAMILPKIGLQSRLPVSFNNETNPLFGIITGVTATTGSEPTGVCDDPPSAGLTKLCMHSFVYGRFSRQTRVFDIDRVGQVTNRGEFFDFNVFGDPFQGAGNNPNLPLLPAGANLQSAARNEIGKSIFELGVSWSRDFAKVTYTGNPTNNTAGGGYKEFYGLDVLINTGYRDAETGVACPAADSIVRSFGGLKAEDNMVALIRQITNIYRNLRHLAVRAGLAPAQIQLTMTYNLFYQITEGWPCSYLSYRCIPQSGTTQFVDSGAAERMRDDMRGDLENYTGQYLLIDGQRISVIVDDAIDETENQDGTFTSDIYFVPLTVMGGRPVTYWEHFNYESPNGPMEMARVFAPSDSYFTSDGGRFLWHKKPPTNLCVQLVSYMIPRLMLLTPYLAARLTDVKCEPLEHERSPFTDSAYFVDGGRTDRNGYGPSFYSPTA
jgi:hypothetical protein